MSIGSEVKEFKDKDLAHYNARVVAEGMPGQVAKALGAHVPAPDEFEHDGKVTEAWVTSTMKSEWDRETKKKYESTIKKEIAYMEKEMEACKGEEERAHKLELAALDGQGGCSLPTEREARKLEVQKEFEEKMKSLKEFYQDKLFDKNKELENPPVPEPIVGKAIVKERHMRCMKNEESVVGLLQGDHFLRDSQSLLDMVLQPGEEHICTLKISRIVNGPGPEGAQTKDADGEGYVSVTRTEKDDHRIHFWMLNKTSMFEAREEFHLEIESEGKKYKFPVVDHADERNSGGVVYRKNTHLSNTIRTATNKYVSKRIQNSTYASLHPIEENLYHVHADMSNSSEYYTKVDGYKQVGKQINLHVTSLQSLTYPRLRLISTSSPIVCAV